MNVITPPPPPPLTSKIMAYPVSWCDRGEQGRNEDETLTRERRVRKKRETDYDI